MIFIYYSMVIITAFSGIISEIIALTWPDKILNMENLDPAEILDSGFYKFIFILSGLYILFLILLFFSEISILRSYSYILLTLSFITWVLKKEMLKFRILQIIESIICFILLIDTLRIIIRKFVEIL